MDGRPPKRSRTDTHQFIPDDGVTPKRPHKKPPLSCAECRRLKLKCDRVFPCASCTKRGCAQICPEGVLVSGKGTRFILANTEQLHSKISQMSERIQLLEDALQSFQTEYQPGREHPLLSADLRNVKSTIKLYGTAQTGNATASTSNSTVNAADTPTNTESTLASTPAAKPDDEDGMSVRYDPGAVAPSSSYYPTDPNTRNELFHDDNYNNTNYTDNSNDYAARVLKLSHDFPMLDQSSWTSQYNHHQHQGSGDLKLREYLRGRLPPRSTADYLWNAARENACWQYNPHPSPTFIPDLISHVYESPLSSLCPRRLALLFMVLAIGTLVDLNQRPESPDAEAYHCLSRASLSEVSILEDVKIETVFTLFYMTWYLLVFSDKKKAAGHAFGLAGLNAKLAVSMGLHRDSKFKSTSQDEIDRRRSLIWELLYLDANLSLSLGRPPSLHFSHMDCKRPSHDPPEHSWKHYIYLHGLLPALELISNSKTAGDYQAMMCLDRKIRDLRVPEVEGEEDGARQVVLRRAAFSCVIETVLLQLHRSFFTRSLSTVELGRTRKHEHAPSAVAVVLSASRMIATVEALWRREPQLSGRILVYWSNAFQAAVALCMLVCRVPFSCISPAALQELQRASELFASAASEKCVRAVQVNPVLEAMMFKANDTYVRWARSYVPPTALPPPAAITDSSEPEVPIAVPPDTYVNAHQSLVQCLVEIHQRAKLLSPLIRTTCRCSARASSCFPSAPPRHPLDTPPDWASPVLPALTASYQVRTEPSEVVAPSTSGMMVVDRIGSNHVPQQVQPLQHVQLQPQPALNVGGVDSLNVDFGAANPTWTEQGIMAWF